MSRPDWVPASDGDVPANAIRGGVDSGKKVFVARASIAGGFIVGKLHQGYKFAHIPFNGDNLSRRYEVLVGDPDRLSWIAGSGNTIPANAVFGGMDPDGQRLYIGRANHAGTVTVGKIYPPHGACYISYDGKEIKCSTYEILVENMLGAVLNK